MDKVDFNNSNPLGNLKADGVNPFSKDKSQAPSKGESNAIKEDVKALSESTKTVQKNARFISDIAYNIAGAFLNTDGSPRDFSDKVGRAKLTKKVDSLLLRLTEVDKSLTDAIVRIAKLIPKDVEAKFSKEDDKRIDQFLRIHYVGLVIAALLGIGLGVLIAVNKIKSNSLEERSEVVEAQYQEQRDAIEFGKYLIRHNPKDYRRFKEYYQHNQK